MRFKHTLQAVALSLSLGLGLSLLSLPARAQTGAPITVDGTNYTPTSGTTITTTGTGSDGYTVNVINGGSLLGADGWSLSTSGTQARGVNVDGTSSFSGTNLNIKTTAPTASGLYVANSSTATLTGGTVATTAGASHAVTVAGSSSLTASNLSISTAGGNTYGLLVNSSAFSGTNINITTTYRLSNAITVNSGSGSITGGTLTTTGGQADGVNVNGSGTATLTDVTMNVTGNLVSGTGAAAGTNTVVLDNIRGTQTGDVVNFNQSASVTNSVTIRNSTLTGNMVSAYASRTTVNLVSGTLTGAANITGAAPQLHVNVDGASKWTVNASSTMSALSNQGVLDMHTGGELRQLTVTSFTQQAGASIAMTLSGAGGAANELVTVSGALTLAGALVLNGDAGAAAASSVEGGSFVLFDKAGTAALTGGFSDIQLNGVSYGAVADGGTFTDGTYTYTLSYHGDAATGALTGGNDVLLHVIPEPGTWAMLVSGLGLLACGQRLSRRSRG